MLSSSPSSLKAILIWSHSYLSSEREVKCVKLDGIFQCCIGLTIKCLFKTANQRHLYCAPFGIGCKQYLFEGIQLELPEAQESEPFSF